MATSNRRAKEQDKQGYTATSRPKRSTDLEKLSDAEDHCVFMKDIWRNAVSHTRKPYNESEAKFVLERVHGFMQFVTTQSAA